MRWIFFCLTFVISGTYGTTFSPVSLKTQLEQSDAIVKGVVNSQSHEEHPVFGIMTKVEIIPEQYFGVVSGEDSIYVYYPGGKSDSHNIQIAGSPVLTVGEKVVVLLNEQDERLWISNLGLGKYSVKRIGNKEIMVNQIFPEHPEFGHVSVKRFTRLAEWIKKAKFVEASKSRLDYQYEMERMKKKNKTEGRSIASAGESREQSEGKLHIIWLVILLGGLGALFQILKNRRL